MASNEPPTQDVDVEHALSASPVVVAEPAEMRADVEQQQQHEVDAGLGPSMSDKHTEEQHQQQLDNRVNPLFELSQAVTAGDLDEVHVFKVSDGHVVLRQGTPPTLFARLAPDAAAQRAQASTSSSSNVANNALASSSVASTLFQHQHSRNASVSSVSSSSKRGIRRRTTSRTSSSYDTAVSTPAAATQAGCHPDAMEVAHLRVQPPQHSHSDEVRMRTLHARNEVRAWPHSSSSAPSSSSSSSASSSSSTHTAEADPQVAQALDHPASPPRIDTAFSSAHDAITDSPVTYSSSAPPMLAPSAPSRVRRHTTATQARAVPLTTVSPPTPDDGAHQDDSETRSDSLSDVRSDARSERSERSGPARSGDVPRANVPRRAYTATAGDVSTSAWAASRAQLVPPAPAPTPVVPSPPQRTTSPTPRARRASSYAASSTFASRRPSDHAVLAADDDIEGNIAAHAESIRAQRAKKRAASSDDEDVAAAARRKEEATEKKPEKPERPLVGNLIGTDHANYVLMYNMLTGIRIAVSRCQAKPQRAITDADYTARHKYSFDIVGNELTPSTRYDFKFKDYAPWVFRELREYFYLDPSDYLVSLTAKYILSELGSPGKSGSFFYFSRDYRFIIKTIRHSEHKFLRSILRDYHEHVKQNPHTLISRFYGLHRVKLPRGRKIHFVIMNNLFPPHRDIHETYDLKGSSIGRICPEEKAALNPHATLKDLNWTRRGKHLFLGPEKKALFEEQLRRDTALLKRLGIMDYSLLTGIHNLDKGNSDKLRDNMLSVFQPTLRRRRATALRQEGISSELDKSQATDNSDRRLFWFYQDEGGMRATNGANEELPAIYYLGIIDILTPYTFLKRLEHFWRGLREDKHMISAVPPREYGDRFLAFIYSSIWGNDESKRPPMVA